MTLGVGDSAPDFTLEGSPEGKYSRAQVLGRPLVLAFYPEDHSPVCSIQLRAYSDGMEEFSQLSALVWGISPQDVRSHKGFAERYGINFPLLSDLDKEVARSYDVLGPLGFYRRSVFVINRFGIITYCHRTTAGLTYKATSTLLEAVREAEAHV